VSAIIIGRCVNDKKTANDKGTHVQTQEDRVEMAQDVTSALCLLLARRGFVAVGREPSPIYGRFAGDAARHEHIGPSGRCLGDHYSRCQRLPRNRADLRFVHELGFRQTPLDRRKMAVDHYGHALWHVLLGVWEGRLLELSAITDAVSLTDAEYARIMSKHLVAGSLQVAMLLFMVWLSVFKPWKGKMSSDPQR